MIQARYGWDDEYILSIPYARFLQLIEQEIKRKEERNRELAFLGWQMTSPFREQSCSFNEYYESLFSTTKSTDEYTEEDSKTDPKESIKRAEEILNMFKK